MFAAVGFDRRGHTTTSYSFERSNCATGTVTLDSNSPDAGITFTDCVPPRNDDCVAPSAVPRSTTPTCTPAGCEAGSTPATFACTVKPVSDAADTTAEPVAPSGCCTSTTSSVIAAELDATNAAESVGENAAVMLCTPTDSVAVVSVAIPSATAATPSCVAPSENATLPAAAGATWAVNVTGAPASTGDAEKLSVVAVWTAGITGGNTASHCSAAISTGTRATMASSSGLP